MKIIIPASLVLCVVSIIIIYVSSNNKKPEGPSNSGNNKVGQQEESEELLLKKFRETPRCPEKLELGKKVVRLIEKGMSKDKVRSMLGEPSNTTRKEKKTLWYYHLWYSAFIRVTFGEDGKVKETFRKVLAGEEEESEELLLKKFRETKWHSDRRVVAKKIVHLIKKGMSKDEIRNMLGDPDHVYEEKRNYWVYDLWFTARLDVHFDKNDKVMDVFLRISPTGD